MSGIAITFDGQKYDFSETQTMSQILEELCYKNHVNANKNILRVFDRDNNPVTNFKSTTTLGNLSKIIENTPFILKIEDEAVSPVTVVKRKATISGSQHSLVAEDEARNCHEGQTGGQTNVLVTLVQLKKMGVVDVENPVGSKFLELPEHLTVQQLKDQNSSNLRSVYPDLVFPVEIYGKSNPTLPLPDQTPVWLHAQTGLYVATVPVISKLNVRMVESKSTANTASIEASTMKINRKSKPKLSFRNIAKGVGRIVRFKSFSKKGPKKDQVDGCLGVTTTQTTMISPIPDYRTLPAAGPKICQSKTCDTDLSNLNHKIKVTSISPVTALPNHVHQRQNSVQSSLSPEGVTNLDRSKNSTIGGVRVLPSRPLAPHAPTVRRFKPKRTSISNTSQTETLETTKISDIKSEGEGCGGQNNLNDTSRFDETNELDQGQTEIQIDIEDQNCQQLQPDAETGQDQGPSHSPSFNDTIELFRREDLEPTVGLSGLNFSADDTWVQDMDVPGKDKFDLTIVSNYRQKCDEADTTDLCKTRISDEDFDDKSEKSEPVIEMVTGFLGLTFFGPQLFVPKISKAKVHLVPFLRASVPS